MFKLLLENCIGIQGQDYNCWICQCTLPFNNFDVIKEHIQQEQHRSIARICAWDKIPQIKAVKRLCLLSEEEYEELVKNNIIFKVKNYYCNICRCTLSRPYEHLRGKAHKLRYENLNTDDKDKSVDTIAKIENKKKNVKSRMKDQIYYLNKTISLKHHHIKLVESTNTYICEICQYSFTEINNIFVHIEEHFHKYNLAKQKVNPIHKLNQINCDIYCKKCNILLDNNETLLQCHCLIHLYKEQPNLNEDIVKFDFDHDDKVNISCLICNVTMHDDKTIAAHLDEPSHQDRLELSNRLISRHSRKKIDNLYVKKNINELDGYNFDPTEDLEVYVKDQKDKTSISLEEYDKFYKCFLCKKSLNNITMLIQHYNEFSVHYHKLKNLFLIYDLLYTDDKQELCDKVNKQLFNSNSNSSSVIDFVQGSSSKVNKHSSVVVQRKSTSGPKEVRLTDNKSIKKKEKKENKEKKLKKPRERRTPLFYNNDKLDIGEKYISMCLEPGSKNIFNIDRNTIHQLEFGTSLTVPYKNERVCIPCGYNILPNFYYLCEHLQCEIHILNLSEMVESSKDLDNHEDQLTYLDLAKSCMQEESDHQVRCFACEESVPNFNDDIEHHINSPNHISKVQFFKTDSRIINEELSTFLKNLWYYVDKFSCKSCNVLFDREINFANHLQEIQHTLNELVKKEKDNKINICLGCCSCWFGQSNYSQHYEEPLHIQTLKRFNLVLPKLPKDVITYLMNFDKIVKDLIKDSNEIACNQQFKEQKLLDCAEDTVRSVYPNVKAYAFGSRLSYLGFATSDVDVFLDCENKYFEIGSKEASQTYIQTTKNQFCKKYAHIWKKEKILLNPRVPIIKLEHRKTQLKCDISFLSGLGVEKSKLIRNYVITYENCRKLILYLKKWFSKCELYGPQAVNAYAISWYAIFYLQLKGIFPSVKQLIDWENKSKIVDGWQCGFLETVPATVMNHSFKDILQGFFSYYAEFNYCTDVVCPLLGKVLKKSEFVNFNDLPEGMEIYKCRVQTEEMEFFRYDSPMCIQDPVDLTQNITKAVSKFQLRHFRSYCAQSLTILLK